jgi:hypothetical protein
LPDTYAPNRLKTLRKGVVGFWRGLAVFLFFSVPFFVFVVLGCFFDLGFEVFAGCVHRSTQKDKEGQGRTRKDFWVPKLSWKLVWLPVNSMFHLYCSNSGVSEGRFWSFLH